MWVKEKAFPPFPFSLTTPTFMPVLRVSQMMVKPFTSSGISDKAFSTCGTVKEGVREGERREEVREEWREET